MSAVVQTRRLPPSVEAELRERFSLRLVSPDGPGFADRLGEARVVIAVPGCPLRADIIGQFPGSVGLIASYSAGVDHVDVEAARCRGIAVTNTPDVLTHSTADIAMLLILSACRSASWAERHLRSGRWAGASVLDMFGVDVQGRTLGVLGLGRIGQATAERARAFGMNVIYHGPREKLDASAGRAQFEPRFTEFMHRSDVLSLHAPLTPATRRIINRESLAAMKRGSVLVNTARGDLVADDDVIEALRRGQLRAAGFDVYAGEPEIHPAYRELDNVTLLPHIGSATVETRIAMGRRVIANIDAYLGGRVLPDLVTE